MSKNKKYGHIDPDDLLRYLSDGLSDEERHALEREIQKDPFAEEALEGLSSLSTEQAGQDLSRLRSRLRKRVEGSRSRIWVRVAASAAILLTAGTLYLTVFRGGDILFDRRIADTETGGADKGKGLQEESDVLTEKTALKTEAKKDMPLQPEGEVLTERTESEKISEPAVPEEPAVEAAEFSAEITPEDEEILAVDAVGATDSIESFALETVAFGDETEGLVADQEIAEPGTGTGEARLSGEAEKEYPAEEYPAGVPRTRRSDLARPAAMDESTIRDYAGMDAAESARKKLAAGIGGPVAVRAVILNDTIPALPDGGLESFNRYITENVRFPGTEGVLTRTFVILSFSVGSGGPASEIEIEESPGEDFSQEALRLLREGPDWYPSLVDGIPCGEKTRLRIEFNRE